jgi:hypothetical protein
MLFVPAEMRQMADKTRKNDLEGHPAQNVPFEMSPGDRAKLSVLIEADGDSDLRQYLLGAMGRAETARGARGGPREIPDRWTIIHTLDRLEEAYQVLAGMPMATRPKQYGSAMPEVSRQKLTHLEWIEAYRSGDLAQHEEEKNRVRPRVTTAQVTRMEQALRWPFEFLGSQPELAKAVSLRAMWAAMRVDIRKRCVRHGLDYDLFNRQWQEGLTTITQQLIARKVPVS